MPETHAHPATGPTQALHDRLDWDRDGADWPHRAHSRFVTVAGQRWHVQQWPVQPSPEQPLPAPVGAAGAAPAPTVLLLHGTGASTHSWRDLAPRLLSDPQGRARQVVALDLPGHGFSDPLPPAQRSLAGMAAALGALLAHEALAPWAVIGHSAGAALMLRLALDGGLAAPRLIGLNPALAPYGGLASRVYAPLARLLAGPPWVARWVAGRGRDPAAVARMIASTGSRLDPAGVALYSRLMASPAHVAGVLAMMAGWDLETLSRDLPRLRARLDLVVASGDRAVPPAQAAPVLARLPTAGLHRLDGLGHLAHEEAPERVAQALHALLAEPV